MKSIFSFVILGLFLANVSLAQNAKKQPLKNKPKNNLAPAFIKLNKGVRYKILSINTKNRKVQQNDLLSIDLLGFAKNTKGKDTLLFNSYGSGKPFFIPVSEPTFNEVFLKLYKNDSIILFVNADSLFTNSFGKPLPDFIAPKSEVKFILKVAELFDEKEVEKLRETERARIVAKDSIDLNKLLSNLKDVKTTSSGLIYVVTKSTNGALPNKGDQVQMLYSGYLLDGTKFDENLNAENPFEFKLGEGQVIKGWDEGVLMMHEGEEYKLIIPSYLAYGEQGTGPIPPNATLVFDVKLFKIKPAAK